ncbi:hypothetical protein S245_030111 [Arachis hypogaea]
MLYFNACSNGTILPSPQNERGDLVVLGEVRHANVPWMIHISGSGADEHIELSMWLRALTVQAQRRNYQGRSSLLLGCEAVSNQTTQQALALPEKEVIQPHLPVRLPCYDFTPVTSPAFGIPLLTVKVTTSGMASSHSVTGGVYKARERIHRRMADRRLLAIPASCRRVAAYNPN